MTPPDAKEMTLDLARRVLAITYVAFEEPSGEMVNVLMDIGYKDSDGSVLECFSHAKARATGYLEGHSSRDSQIESLREALDEYGRHMDRCVLGRWEGGEPIEGGGYRTKYAGKWYQSRPVDETPKCNCGFEEALKPFMREDGKHGKA